MPIGGYPRYEISNKKRVRLFSGKLIKVYNNEYVKLNGIKININFLLEVNAPDSRLDGIIWPI